MLERPNPLTRTLSLEERRCYADLIESLKARRKALGMSQAALDDRLGTSEGMVAKWEAMMRLPGAFFLMCWTQALGVRLEIKVEK